MDDSAVVSGANSPELSVIASAGLEVVYACVVSNAYAITTSNPVVHAISGGGGGPSDCVSNLNDDGILDLSDINIFTQNFVDGCD